MKAALKDAVASEMQCGIPFAEPRIRNIVIEMKPSPYLPKYPRSFHVRYVRFGLLVTRISEVLPRLNSLNERYVSGKYSRISYQDRHVLYSSRDRFGILLTKGQAFYMKYTIKCTTTHAPRFYRIGEQLLQNLDDLFDESKKSLKPRFTGLTNEKLGKVLGERRLVKLLYFRNFRLYKYVSRSTENLWIKKAAAGGERLVYFIHKQFQEYEQQGCSISDIKL